MLLDDPRLSVIDKRLANIRTIIPVMSPKGGVGKTLVSTLLAYSLGKHGFKTALLDLDITNPTAHIVLGIDTSEVKPREEKGLIPPSIHGIYFMSIAYFIEEDKPLPLRGDEIDNVIREILAITIWGSLDVLIIDTPPGTSDEVLDVLSYFKDIQPIIVTTPSPLSIKSLERLLQLLNDYNVKVLGVIENMYRSDLINTRIYEITRKYQVKYLGSIPYEKDIDKYIGDIRRLEKTLFYKSIEKIASTIKI